MPRDTYVLKHCDNDVLEFNIDKENNTVDYLNVLDNKFSPLNDKASEGTKLVTLNGWLNNRCISNSREGIERLRKFYKVNDLRILMFAQMGLSLSDHYWIDKNPFTNKWKNINLFENRYSDVLGRVLFDKKIKIVQDIKEYYDLFNPDITTGGNLRKYWKYNGKDGKSYLVKAGSGERRQEPFNEYFATLLSKELNIKHTPYNVIKDGKEWVSTCPCIADINTEMVSAEDIKRKYGIEKSYKGFTELGQKKAVVGFTDSVNEMIVLDYMINNTDRHWGNFGVLRDSASGSWKGLIPLFDNGYSLWNNDIVDINKPVSNLSFADYNEDCIGFVDITKYVKKIPDLENIFLKAFNNYENKDRKNALSEGVKIKNIEVKEYIEQFLENTKNQSRKKRY